MANRMPRRVHFAADVETVRLMTIPSYMSKDDYYDDNQWYLESELDAFKTESRQTCAKMRMNGPENVVDLTSEEIESDNDDCLRGLEARMSRERQMNRTLAIRAILSAQHRFRDPEVLALAARRCTAWAKEIARNTAIRDYYQAYFPDQVEASKPPAMPSAICPLVFLRKRLQEKDEDVDRRVRSCNGSVVAR